MDLFAGITEGTTALVGVLSTMAQTIGTTPLLLLGAVTLPMISFGIGALVRLIRQA